VYGNRAVRGQAHCRAAIARAGVVLNFYQYARCGHLARKKSKKELPTRCVMP
jgi:hypothetical protein